jgi:hypothetical protein
MYRRIIAGIFLIAWPVARADEPSLVIDSAMTPPSWALLERQVLKSSSEACDRFAAKYLERTGVPAAHATMGNPGRSG